MEHDAACGPAPIVTLTVSVALRCFPSGITANEANVTTPLAPVDPASISGAMCW